MHTTRALEEARLEGLPQEQRAAYEAEAARLRVEAGLAQKAAMRAALEGAGQRVVIDCSYGARPAERQPLWCTVAASG
jgi:hypothetical protein